MCYLFEMCGSSWFYDTDVSAVRLRVFCERRQSSLIHVTNEHFMSDFLRLKAGGFTWQFGCSLGCKYEIESPFPFSVLLKHRPGASPVMWAPARARTTLQQCTLDRCWKLKLRNLKVQRTRTDCH